MNYTANVYNEFNYPLTILGMSSYYDGKTLEVVIAGTNGGSNWISLIDWTYY